MRVKNCTHAPITIAGVHIITAGAEREFDDAQWAMLGVRPAVVDWLARGKLKELADADVGVTVDAPANEITVTADPVTLSPPAKPKRGKKKVS